MTKPAEIVAAIYHYLPASVRTRDLMMSGQPITSDLLIETLDRSVNDGLNLALHCADEGIIAEVFEKLDERQAMFIHNKIETASDEEKHAFVYSSIAFEYSTKFLSSVETLRKLEREIPLLDHVEIKHELLSEMDEISKRHIADHEQKYTLHKADMDDQIFKEIFDATSQFYPAIPMVKQLASACALENIKLTGHSNLDLWQESHRKNSALDFTTEGLNNHYAISEYVVNHSDAFMNPSSVLGFIGKQLRHFSPEQRTTLVSNAISNVKEFSSDSLNTTGAGFYFQMLKLSLEPNHQVEALELADKFSQKFFTQSAKNAHFLELFDGGDNDKKSAQPMASAVAKLEVFERNPAIAYEILSRINQIHPDFDAKKDPSKLFTLSIDKEYLSAPLAFYLAKDPNNEQIIRDSITNTWHLELVDSLTASSPAKKRREQGHDTGFSM